MDTWNDKFFSELDKSQGAARSTQTLLEDQDSIDDELEAAPLTKMSLPEAIHSLQQVKNYLQFSGYGSEANSISVAINTITEVKMKKFMLA